MLVNTRFQVLFHSPFGVLFTFPSQYCFTIGHRLVFRLWGWSPNVLYKFHVFVHTPDTARFHLVSPTRLSLPTVWLPIHFGYHLKMLYAVHNPACISTCGLASYAFARRYSRNLVWFLFLRLLRCFSSAGSPYTPMYSVYTRYTSYNGVSPFGYLRIRAYLQLPAAFRSLSRPSSASDAKAFTLRSF